jgi:hypothetical protein
MRRRIPPKNQPHEFSENAPWTIRVLATTNAIKRRTHTERGRAQKMEISYPRVGELNQISTSDAVKRRNTMVRSNFKKLL